MAESIRPIHFGFDLIVGHRELRMVLGRWSVFGIPLPLVSGPQTSDLRMEKGRLG
jgi:hypothetical protein